jgi:hypothetical protein
MMCIVAAIFSFKCACCGSTHEGSPSFGYPEPAPWLAQTKDVQKAGRLSSDLCTYANADGAHYFIRGCIEIPIHGVEEPYLWGVWVSLSQKNYNRYVETFNAAVTSDRYFGWLCNRLPFYPDTHSLKTEVAPRDGKQRPLIILEPTEHPLSMDFQNGISIARAQEIAEICMHPQSDGT